MAEGKEDLREKNKDSAPLSTRYDDWRMGQGREDAEMLQEKSAGWSSLKASRGDYDAWEEE